MESSSSKPDPKKLQVWKKVQDFFGFTPDMKLDSDQQQKVRAFLWDMEKQQRRDYAREQKDPKLIGELLCVNSRTPPQNSPIEVDLFIALQGKSLTTGRPRQQYPVGPYFIDIAFPDVKLAIECDGKQFHSSPADMARDQRRTQYLGKLGWTVTRFTGSEINRRLYDCVDRITIQYEDMCRLSGISEPWEYGHYAKHDSNDEAEDGRE